MLQTAVTFFILALLAFFLGANNIGIISMEIGRTLLWVFLAVALISGIAHLTTGRRRRLS